MFCDYHVHTNYSDDSFYPMEEVIQDAIAMGMEEICFTDHVDYGVKVDWDGLTPEQIAECEYWRASAPDLSDPEGMKKWLDGRRGKIRNVNYPAYFAELNRLQENYHGRITIKKGLEFGVQTHTTSDFEKLYARYPLDFVLLSIHQVEDKEPWSGEYAEGRNQDAYYQDYYHELLHVVQTFKHYSVLAHVDMPVRYDSYGGGYPFEKVRPILTEIFRTVIADGKGIELNTSCFYYGLADLTPARDILKLYRELGGTILTVGSDSHKKGQLGGHIPAIYEELKALGFEQIYTFEGMEPIPHAI